MKEDKDAIQQGFHENAVLGAVLGIVCLLCIAQSAFAGTIVGWDTMKTSNEDLTSFSAIAAGRYFLVNERDLPLENKNLICCAGYRLSLRRNR